MAITTTQELYDRVAAAADMPDSFVTPAQFSYWATQENLALATFIARSGWTQDIRTQTIVVNGTENNAYPLTVPPLAIVAIHQVRDRRVRPIHVNNAIDFLREVPGTPITTGNPTEYRALWDQLNDRVVLNFYPQPSTGMVLLVSYIPEPSKLSLTAGDPPDSATFVSYPMGWEERIVLGVARRALAKEESDETSILKQIAETERYIEECVFDRVLSENPTIRNLDADRRGWRDKVLYPPPAMYWWP